MYSRYTKIKPLPSVCTEYIDSKKERAILREKVIQEYTRLFVEEMWLYHVRVPIKEEMMLRLTINLYVRGIRCTRKESVKLYFDAEIPYHIVQDMKQTQITIQLSERVRLKSEKNDTISYVKRINK